MGKVCTSQGDPVSTVNFSINRSALEATRSLLSRHLQTLTKYVSDEEYRLHVLELHGDELAEEKTAIDKMWHRLRSEITPGSKEFEETFQEILRQSADVVATQQRITELTATLTKLRGERESLYEMQRSLDDLSASASGADDLQDGRGITTPRQAFIMIEEERMRIARDMHDGPAQSLANLVLQAEILERLLRKDPNLVIKELADFKDDVRHVLDDTRRLIFDLRPMTLDDLGLVPTLRKFTKEFQDNTKVMTMLRVNGEDVRLPGSYEQTLFRIIQEALNNVRKHAKAKNVDVTISFAPHEVSAVVHDDGVGFDTEHVEDHVQGRDHLGLVSMRERAGLENGTLTIESELGLGTTVKVALQY